MLDNAKTLLLSALDGDAQSILLLAALYALVVCGYSCVYQLRVRAWPSVIGRLRNSGIEEFGATERVQSEQQYVSSALYDYDVAGQSHQGNKISPWVIVATHNMRFVLSRQLKKLSIGATGEIEVYYNPANPRKSVLVRPSLTGLLVTFTLGIAPLALYLSKYGFAL